MASRLAQAPKRQNHNLNRIEQDPDRRVREAIALVFSKFAELQTVRQVLVWIRQENILLPAIVEGAGKRPIEWKIPVHHTLHHRLTNPVYAGAYAFGRRGARVSIEDGRKHVTRSLRRRPTEWDVLIKDHHDGYLSWAEFERNQELISDNANGKSYLGRGSVRKGGALLSGLCRCARCGRKLQVSYGSTKGFSQRYACRGAFSERAEMSCISFGGMRIDRAIAAEVLERVKPLGIEATCVPKPRAARAAGTRPRGSVTARVLPRKHSIPARCRTLCAA